MSVGGVVKMGPRMREDDGRGKAVRECPYVGITERDIGGQPQGLALRRRGQAIRGKNGGRDGSPHPRG